MKQYVLDELRQDDYKKIKNYFDQNYQSGSMGGIYWIFIAGELLTDIQAEHLACQPFYFAVELQESRLSGELLIRSSNRIRCNCISYASKAQRDWFIELIDTLLETLDIKI